MSIQPRCPSDLPRRVRVDIFGQSRIADVVETSLRASAGGGATDILTVAVDGQHYRVPAASVDPVPR